LHPTPKRTFKEKLQSWWQNKLGAKETDTTKDTSESLDCGTANNNTTKERNQPTNTLLARDDDAQLEQRALGVVESLAFQSDGSYVSMPTGLVIGIQNGKTTGSSLHNFSSQR
jgi:hypothetical protein